jgi:putative ABC transport system permease protein
VTSETATDTSEARSDTSADASPSHQGGGSPSTPRFLARWLAGWRVAIRMARRDALRYKWRSALTVAMVGLPVLVLTCGITLVATNDISVAESVPRIMGSAQARISEGEPARLIQSPEGRNFGSKGGANDSQGADALTVPGFAPDSGWTASKVQRLTGGRVLQTLEAEIPVTQGKRTPTVTVLGVDARDPLARGITELASGRWATTKSEVVVTEAGIAAGLPRTGSLTALDLDGNPRRLSVVGVATGYAESGPAFLISTPQLVTDVTDTESVLAAYLIERTDPVTWSDVRRLNDYGLLVQSRQVFLNPPSRSELDPDVARTIGSDRRFDVVLLLAAVGLIIETTLLAGPAFAVSAARQRRSLAVAASNGAEPRQLRRYVLAQAIVLGLLSAAIAVAAGLLLTLAGLTWWQAQHPEFATGPFEVSWPLVGGVLVSAVVASLVAALLPARGVSRLDLVAVLTGRPDDRRTHRGLPLVGIVVMVISSLAIILRVAAGGDEGLGLSAYPIVVGAVGLVLGCLMVIPAVLALVGRLGTHLVVPLRLAARDTARLQGRSVPAVAAIMTAVATLTALSIGVASDTRQRELEHRAQGPLGHGRVALASGQDDDLVRSVFATYAPDLVLYPVGTVADPSDMQPGSTLKVVAAKPAGCSDKAIFSGFAGAEQVVQPVDQRCVRLGAGAQQQHGQIQVTSLEALTAAAHVSDVERRILQSGGTLLFDPGLVQGGFADFVTGQTRVLDGSPATPVVTGHQRLPAAVVDGQAWRPALTDEQVGAWILPETAAKIGWPVSSDHLEVTSPSGMISTATESALNAHLVTENQMRVERGFQNDYWPFLLILFSAAGLLVLIASLLSTALWLAESQNEMATLAALGATRRTRRGIAAGQTLVVAACGCALGLIVGLVPGIALTWPLTTRGWDMLNDLEITKSPTIVIPWLPLLAVCLGVPLLAAGLAWVAVRRHPQVSRRIV